MQYHSRTARCPHGDQCLLGHKDAKEAWNASRAAQRTAGQQLEIEGQGPEGGPAKMNVDSTKAPSHTPPVGASSPTVDFQHLAQQNATIGFSDEMRRLQESVLTLRNQANEHKAFALNQTEHLRQLQS
jgi:hypothetical protein